MSFTHPFSHITPEQRDVLYAADVPVTESVGSGRNAASMTAYSEWRSGHPENPVKGGMRDAEDSGGTVRFSVTKVYRNFMTMPKKSGK